MTVYRIADFLIGIRAHYPFLDQQCRDYRAEEGAVPDFTIEVSEEEVRASLEQLGRFSPGYHESICVYRHICTAILHRDAMLMHAAVVGVDGRAYAFSAKSGTGKSTHIGLWQQCYGDRVTVINGDKPILRLLDGRFVAYGTPWCGKEGWNTNRGAELAALCFLERSPDNFIRRMEPSDAVDRVFHQLLRPSDAEEMEITLRLTDRLLREVPIYRLGCNISEEAARLSYETLTGTRP